MIIGISILCDNCLRLGPQLSDRFFVGLDPEGNAPMITVVCPACGEVHEVVFCGTGSFDTERPT